VVMPFADTNVDAWRVDYRSSAPRLTEPGRQTRQRQSPTPRTEQGGRFTTRSAINHWSHNSPLPIGAP
jgi:hypothetical protein